MTPGQLRSKLLLPAKDPIRRVVADKNDAIACCIQFKTPRH
jgi:hypothetical protein